MRKADPYVMLPGSRLYIGSHGKPEESLGAQGQCCGTGACPPMGAYELSGTNLLLAAGALALGTAIFLPKTWKKVTRVFKG